MANRAPMDRLPPAELRFLRRAGRVTAAHGYRLYLVGGPVRDLLLGHPSADLDLMVEGDAVAAAEVLAAELGGQVRGHSHFGTVKLHLPERVVDVATARTETYPHPGSLPVVTPSAAADDLCRRDFGINALAVDLAPPRFGRLLDPCGGLADLEHRRLRVLHDRSFLDDPLRLIRAVRLRCRLDLRLERHTAALAHQAIAGGALGSISRRRLQEEFRLFLAEPAQRCQVRVARQLGLLEALAPGSSLDAGLGDRLSCAARLLAWLQRRPHPEHLEGWLVNGLALLAGLPPDTGLTVGRHLLPGRQAERALPAVTLERARWLDLLGRPLPPSELTSALDTVPAEAVAALACCLPAAARPPLRRYLTRYRHVRPRLGGRDLLALGYTPSSRWREALAALRAARLDGRTRSRRDETRLAAELLTAQSSLRLGEGSGEGSPNHVSRRSP